jgi:signal transduction histidine kinase
MSASQQPHSRLDQDRLRRLIEAGRSVVAQREPDGVLERLLLVAREVTGAQYAAIGVLDDTREALAEFITAGLHSDAKEAIGPPPRGRGVLGLLMSHPEPLRLSDVGAHPLAYGLPPGHPTMTSFLGVPILIGGEAWGNLYLTNKRDGDFDDVDQETAVVLAAWSAIAVERARLYRETEQRRVELERSIAALEATSEIARAVGGETRLDRVLQLLAARACALVEASGVVILLPDGNDFVVAATAGEIPRELAGRRIEASGAMAAADVLTAGQPETAGGISGPLRRALAELGMQPRTALLSPLVFRGSNVGVIEAFDRLDGSEFRVDDERLLLAAAAVAATAVATAQSLEREWLRRSLAAAEEERGRWARELHDDTLQALGGLRVLLSSARRSNDVESLHATLQGAVDQLADEISNLRALITELRPAALDELGLSPALEALMNRAQVTHGLEITAMIELDHAPPPGVGDARLDPNVETAIYRIVQESITNAAKHSGADRVDVAVVERHGEVEIAIRDDGRGFDVSAPTGGFGLTGIRERVALAGGRLEIVSSCEGTAVLASLPAVAAVAAVHDVS